MSGEGERMSGEGAGPVRPALAIAVAVTGFIALVVAGLGLASLFTASDVIRTTGLGQVPGVLGVVAATGVLAALLVPVLARPKPSAAGAVWIAAAVLLAYLMVTGIAAALVSGDVAVGASVAAGLAVRFPAVVVVASGMLSAAAAIVLVRAPRGRPRWPWEDDEDA